MTKLYIVGEEEFNYNDEVYYKEEFCGSKPIKAYKSKEKAQQVVDDENLEFFESRFTKDSQKNYNNIEMYYYDIDDLFNGFTNQNLFDSFEDLERFMKTSWPKFSKAEKIEFVKSTSLRKFVVEEVDYEE